MTWSIVGGMELCSFTKGEYGRQENGEGTAGASPPL
jgi:hypothetical protein